MEDTQILLPLIVMKEEDMFVASCPVLDIATQGKTEQEVKENMADLIDEYLNDKDTPKPNMKYIQMTSLSYIPAKLPKKGDGKWQDSNQLLHQK